MNKAEQRALEAYPKMSRISEPHGLIPADNKSHYLGDGNEEKREGFIVGYNQAEKDLIENEHEKSWRLDKQLWSGFKDIEEASYQYIYDASNDWAYEIPTWGDVQDAFKAGSEWKEGLELTWEDIETILSVENDILRECNIKKELVIETYPKGEDYYGEILKRFKERKEKP